SHHLCGSSCVSNTDTATCGVSCSACPDGPEHGMATCDGTSCGFACAATYKQCGQFCIPSIDCCADLDCQPTAYVSSTQCVAGACKIVTCSAGRGDCNGNYADGCELDITSDAQNCGECGRGCKSYGTTTLHCSNGVCDSQCEKDFTKAAIY